MSISNYSYICKIFMQIIKFNRELKERLDALRQKGSVGFVPTMGALHDGHRSLLKKCKSENRIAICSIFVNPTQFNDKNDLKNYPRNLEKDLQIIADEGFDFTFCPDEKEMYPTPDMRQFEFGNLDKIMEGKHRPGHFNGVAQIVTKLFDTVRPDNAYFGEKDFQQLAIIKYLVRTFKLPINIVSCPTIREKDGLALSSRNLLLGSEERKNATLIWQTLFKAKSLQNELNVSDLKKWVIEQVNSCPYFKVEYFEIVDDLELHPILNWDEKNNKVGCIAVRADTVRLIDNIRFN